MGVEDPSVASSISSHKQIIAFRNILVHAYFRVRARLIWDLLEDDLPRLVKEVEGLLNQGS
ncbi:MAG: DUF86 domain-containing protein [Acidobacteriales bacterium]|nr:DUF86 domain-containing protein [Terriglobales bacterium]